MLLAGELKSYVSRCFEERIRMIGKTNRMKQILVFLLTALCCVGCSSDIHTQQNRYRVTVPGSWSDCPVVIGDIPVWARSAVVLDKGREIPSQLDRALNELVFVTGISGSKEFEVTFSSEPSVFAGQARVHAQMWRENPDKSLACADTIVVEKNAVRPALHHSGPALESELAAYRILFDEGQTVDTYGKKQMRLELAETNWNPSDKQLEKGYGYDNLRVGGSIGVGSLRGWDSGKGEMIPVGDCKRREARILAKGPVRAIVEIHVEGWRLCGREIDMTSRYMLYANHGELQVENTLGGDFQDLVFTTGIVRMARNEAVKDREVIASLGEDYPCADTLDRERERVGLVVAVPQEQVVSQIDDPTSYLFQLKPDARGRIDYIAQMLWRRSDWLQGRSDDECMLAMLDAARLCRRKVIVSRIR